MKPDKQKIKDFAKEQFLEVDADGNKKYTWHDISNLILKKFKKKIHLSTIQKWSKSEDWHNTYEKIKQAGIEKSNLEIQKKENILIDAKANDIAEIYKGRKTLADLSRKHLTARLTGQSLKINGDDLHILVETKELISILKDSEQVILNLNDKKDQKDDISIKVDIVRERTKAIFPTLQELQDRLNESDK